MGALRLLRAQGERGFSALRALIWCCHVHLEAWFCTILGAKRHRKPAVWRMFPLARLVLSLMYQLVRYVHAFCLLSFSFTLSII
jgi:hypothetical protein